MTISKSIVGVGATNNFIASNAVDATEVQRCGDAPIIVVPRAYFNTGLLKALCKSIESALFTNEFKDDNFEKIKVDVSDGK
eukprot:20150-Pyramimonas_sp.AAC.1